jgi:hypothetical protein
MEYILTLSDYEWSNGDEEPEEDAEFDTDSDKYSKMIKNSLIQTGNNTRLKRAIEHARNGKDVTSIFSNHIKLNHIINNPINSYQVCNHIQS